MNLDWKVEELKFSVEECANEFILTGMEACAALSRTIDEFYSSYESKIVYSYFIDLIVYNIATVYGCQNHIKNIKEKTYPEFTYREIQDAFPGEVKIFRSVIEDIKSSIEDKYHK